MEDDLKPRRVTTLRQIELMINFVEQHTDLALGRVRSKEARELCSRLWKECTTILNTEGPCRSAKEWSKFWNDYKCRVRSKLLLINKSQKGIGGAPQSFTALTPLEEKVAIIIGWDVTSIPVLRLDPFQSIEIEEQSMIPTKPILLHTPQSPSLEIEIDVKPLISLESVNSQALGGYSQATIAGQASVDNQPSIDNQASIDSQASIESQASIDSQLSFGGQASIAGQASIVDQASITSQPAPTMRSTLHNHRIPPARNSSGRSRRIRFANRPRPTLQRSNRDHEETLSTIARIEMMRARTDELLAESMLRQAKTAERHERVMAQFANSFQVMAEAMDRMSRGSRNFRGSNLGSDEEL